MSDILISGDELKNCESNMKQFQKTDYGTTFKGMSVKTKKSPHSKNPDQNRVNEPA